MNTDQIDGKAFTDAAKRARQEGRSGSRSPSCSQDRFKGWTVKDYEKEIRRVEASRRHHESVIPKLKRAIRHNELKAFDPSI